MSRRPVTILMLAFMAALACLPGTASAALFDRDNDGWLRFVDCNDRNEAIFPGAPELCEGLDNDCDNVIDEGCPVPPEVTIVSPADGQIAPATGLVIQAVVTDDEANPVLHYSLTTDAGAIAVTGVRATSTDDTVEITATVPCGAQTLTLTVTDNDGLVGSDSVSLIADDPPVATIVSPTDGDVYGQGFIVDLSGLATDACQSPTELEVYWTDNGELVFSGFASSTGTTTYFLEDLEPGEHEISLIVQDPNGQFATDTVFITVLEGETCSATDDLALQYNFEEGSGSLFLDSSGNGNIAQIQGTGAWTSSYKSGAGLAMSFNGTDTFAVAPHSPSLNATDEATVVMWIRLDSLPPVVAPATKNWFPLLSKGEADQFQTERNYSLYVASNQSTHFSASLPTGTGTTNPTESLGKVPVGQWIQVAGRATISSGGTITYFLNGQRDRVYNNRGNTSLLVNSEALYVGKTLEVNPPFHGLMDDVRVYPCALSDSQVRDLYNQTR